MKDILQEYEVNAFVERNAPGDDPTDDEKNKFRPFSREKLLSGESEMGKEVALVANSVMSSHQSNDLVAKDTADLPDKINLANRKLRPDVIIYPTNKEAMDAYKIQKTDDADGESLARVRWAWACVPIELKSTASKAPFAKANSKHFFTGGQLGRLARGQIADYAAMILNHQHRVFCFMIVITGVEARLLRWDRAGAVVTNAFDLTDSEQVKPMYRFLYRLSKMTAEQRGYDPTVVPASNDEITSMNVARDALPESDYRRKRIAAAMTRGWQIQKIRMREEDVVSVEAWRRAGQDSTSAPTDSSSLSSSVQAGVAPCSTPSSTPPNAHAPASSDSRNETGSADSGGRYFLVGKPEHHTDSPIGRGTRGYIAYDMKTGKFVFLRDSWRYETSKSEIKVYEQLHRNRVRHIATPICGGDVIGQDNSPQQTCAQEFDKDKKMPKYIHNRLVVEEIGISLLEFPTGRDLVVVMTHALIAHEDAWKFAEVMHRDISVANILMLPDANPEAVGVSVRGILNDWDLCKYKEELGAATQRSRSGTWQFMSASLLKGPGIKTHEVADDLESYMHVLNWLCLRFFKTSHVNLRSYVSDSYDLVTKVGKHRTGGHEKYQAIKDGRAMANLEQKEGTPLKVLVESLATMCHVHYQAVDSSPSSEPGDDRPRRHPIITIGGASPDTYKWSDIYNPRTRQDEPKVKKDDPLVNHRLFIAAFLIACSAPASEFPAKEEDKFAFFKDIHTEHSRPSSLYQSSAGSKRRSTELVSSNSSSSSSDEEQEEPPEKRLKLRSTKANRLRGLPEETLSSINGDEVTEDEYETEDSGASS